MKKKKSVWRIMIGMILLSIIFVVALVLLVNNSNGQYSVLSINPVFTSNFLTNHGSNDPPFKDEKTPGKDRQPFFLVKAISVPNINLFLIVRQVIPSWEKKAFIDSKPYVFLCAFLPSLIICMFSIFYQASRTSPGDDDLVISEL